MIKVCLCDDEESILNKYTEKINKIAIEHSKNIEIERYSSGENLIFELEDEPNKFDIVVIDILMKKINGIETTEILRKYGFIGIIIFLTSSEEFALDSFKVEPLNYILKNETGERFNKVFRSALFNVEKNFKKNIIISNKQTHKILNIETIMYIEIINKKVILHDTFGIKDEVTCTLDFMYERVKEYGFIRCHKSYIVNINYVLSFNKLECFLKKGINIPIGRKYANEFKEQFLSKQFDDVLI